MGIFCYPNATGAVSNGKRFQRYGFPGSPDILGILPCGQWLGVEIKTGKAVQNKNQIRFQKKIEDNHGMYIVIRHFNEVNTWISIFKDKGLM